MSITPSKQTSVYRQVDAIMKTEDIYGGDKYTAYDPPAIFNQQTVNQQQSSSTRI